MAQLLRLRWGGGDVPFIPSLGLYIPGVIPFLFESRALSQVFTNLMFPDEYV